MIFVYLATCNRCSSPTSCRSAARSRRFGEARPVSDSLTPVITVYVVNMHAKPNWPTELLIYALLDLLDVRVNLLKSAGIWSLTLQPGQFPAI